MLAVVCRPDKGVVARGFLKLEVRAGRDLNSLFLRRLFLLVGIPSLAAARSCDDEGTAAFAGGCCCEQGDGTPFQSSYLRLSYPGALLEIGKQSRPRFPTSQSANKSSAPLRIARSIANAVLPLLQLTASIKENPRLQAAAEELRKAGLTVNDAVSHALKGMEENAIIRGSREAVSRTLPPFPFRSPPNKYSLCSPPQIYKAGAAVGSAAMTASEPLRSTEAYKAVAAEITEALDDAASNVQHGGYVEKEDRRRRREARLAKAGRATGFGARKVKVEEDPECVVHPSPFFFVSYCWWWVS